MLITVAQHAPQPPQHPYPRYDPVLDSISHSATEALATASLQPQQFRPTSSYPQTSSAPASTQRSINYARSLPTHRVLAPAPPRSLPPNSIPDPPSPTTFFDLPAEIRVEVYKFVLTNVTIHILPLQEPLATHHPHSLALTSRQVRYETLPLIHSLCPILVNITDFNFSGIVQWLSRIPPNQQYHLAKNEDLIVRLNTSNKGAGFCDNLRQWLHTRADPYRPQPGWRYVGPTPKNKVANDLRRRLKRMTEEGKKREMEVMLAAIGVRVS